ncbi:MAG TPA: glycosyltransferase family 39 protein [Lacipirellulaceae bacterium]|nr:glycosyltransferase family 39 protein [Lacipirellulaceae bacterium]
MRNEKPTSDSTPAAVSLVVVALLAWYFLSAVTATIGKSVMFDEMFHLVGGYTYWERGDFRMQPENGNLPQRWDALPLLFRDTKPPQFDGNFWWHSSTPDIGYDFLFNEGNDADVMLLCGRAMNAFFGVAVGVLIFLVSRSYFGVRGALVSVALFAFCPTMLANGAMITSDMAAALFFFATVICLWRVLQLIRWQNVLISGLVMGGLFVAKFGAFMIIPIGLLLAAVQIVSPRAIAVSWAGRKWQIQRRGRRILAQVALIIAHAAIVWAVIWAFYDFRFSMFASTTMHLTEHGGQITVDEPLKRWSEVLNGDGVVERFIRVALPWHLLPEPYLYGFAFTWHFGKARACFLNGAVGSTGWPSFFPYCLLVKTPPALFVLTILSAIWLVRSWLRVGGGQARLGAIADSLYRSAPLWVLFVVYWAFAISSHLNIGHRHILPTYPLMLVFAGGAAYWFSRRETAESDKVAVDPAQPGIVAKITNWTAQRRWPAAAILTLICIGSFLVESLWSWPNYVTYFNQFAGGPRHAYRHLVDSSLDWGQDLPALKKWLFDVGLVGSTESRTYLSYFGTGSPEYYGITATKLPCFFDWGPPSLPEPLQPGTYCVSATMLQNIYTRFFGRWTNKYEATYRELGERVNVFLRGDQATRAKLVATAGGPYWLDVFRDFQQARLARLTSYLRGREPDFEINNTILIYGLSDEQLRAALEEPLPEMINSP